MKAKLLFLFAICTLSASLSLGQAACYSVDSITYNPFSFTDGQTVSLSDDVHSGLIPIGFDFCFFGNHYINLVIASNSYITFDVSQAGQYSPWSINNAIPSNVLPLNTIMGPYQDINPSTSGQVTYKMVGIAPFRKFVISFYQVAMFSCTSLGFSNQIVLHETTNYIDILIENKPLCGSWNGGVALEGILNADGTEGYVVPGRNYPTQWSASQDAYRFTPLCSCASSVQFNIISGYVYDDITQNCQVEPGEAMSDPVQVCVGGNINCTYTDVNGYYALIVADTGTYTVTADLPNGYAYECPANGQEIIHFNTLDSQVTVNFGDTSLTGGCADLEMEMAVPFIWMGNPSPGVVNYCNTGNIAAINTTLSIQTDLLNPITSASLPYSYNGAGTYTFQLNSVPAGQCGSISFTTSPSPSLTHGEIKCYAANIISLSSECDLFNNNTNECLQVIEQIEAVSKQVQSFTPLQNGYVTVDTISAYQQLQYQIVFRNTDTVPIVSLLIRDTIDSHLKPSSLVPGISSHNYQHTVSGNEVRFVFDTINLTPYGTNAQNSVGFVRYTIDQQPGNQHGDHIYNRATCYFEPPSEHTTNYTDNIIRESVGINELETNFFNLYPNPTGDGFYLTTEKAANYQVSFIDLMGKTIRTETFTGNSHFFERKGLANGVYLIDVRNSEGERIETLRVAIK